VSALDFGDVDCPESTAALSSHGVGDGHDVLPSGTLFGRRFPDVFENSSRGEFVDLGATGQHGDKVTVDSTVFVAPTFCELDGYVVQLGDLHDLSFEAFPPHAARLSSLDSLASCARRPSISPTSRIGICFAFEAAFVGL